MWQRPGGRRNCIDLGHRSGKAFRFGENDELLSPAHAEANAIIHASRNDTLGGTLYLVGKKRL